MLNIVHRDLKPENLLLETPNDQTNIKIADFGFATFITPQMPKLFQRCGSLGFVAPEILRNEGYGFAADMFSAGAILYFLLTGKNAIPFPEPFDH